MLRITERLAEQHRALGIATGENVGQVASQTLHSMHTINEVTNYPMIRPVITMDKLEIIKIAQEIDTYELSILPYEDCCTIFQPKNPKTRPAKKHANHYEKRLDVEKLIANAVERTDTMIITDKDNNENKMINNQDSPIQSGQIDDLF